jgi:hypothetical protein
MTEEEAFVALIGEPDDSFDGLSLLDFLAIIDKAKKLDAMGAEAIAKLNAQQHHNEGAAQMTNNGMVSLAKRAIETGKTTITKAEFYKAIATKPKRAASRRDGAASLRSLHPRQ